MSISHLHQIRHLLPRTCCRHFSLESNSAAKTALEDAKGTGSSSSKPISSAAAFPRRSLAAALKDKDLVGSDMQVSGWVRAARRMKDFTFLDLDDGTAPGGHRLQVVVDNADLSAAAGSKLDAARHHSSVSVRGRLRRSSHPKQEVELALTSDDPEALAVHNASARVAAAPGDDEALCYPFAPRKTYPDKFARRHPGCRAKLAEFAALLRVRSALTQGIHVHFQRENFTFVHTPIFTTNDCEGACEVFSVRPLVEREAATLEEGVSPGEEDEDEETEAGLYSKDEVFLTVSGQLHLEAVCNGVGKVYNFGPVFRVEGGRSRRHLTEFTMVEAEEAFDSGDVDDLTSSVRALVASAAESVLQSPASADLDLISSVAKTDTSGRADKLAHADFVTMSYSEAVSALQRKKFEIADGKDLRREHELFLTDKYCKAPVFVVDWPSSCKPFYCRVKKDGGEERRVVDAMDLLLPGVGEVAGGSLREHRADVLRSRIGECFKGATPDECGLRWYVDLRETLGSAPTSGFGLGFDRLVQYILGVNNIRDAVPFARTPYSCPL